MNDHRQRAEKIVRRIQALAAFSEEDGMICRRYGTEAYLAAARKLLSWMEEAGLESRIDAIGNVRGRLRGDTTDAARVTAAGEIEGWGVDSGRKTLVIASHIDTVVNAGKWDGPLGVVMGLDLMENLRDSRTLPPFDIELIAFCDEEGVRFHTSYLGSNLLTGHFEPSLLERPDGEGIPLRQAILDIGGDPKRFGEEVFADGSWLGYFEIHIEQGPILYERNIPVAGVRAIAGQIRAEARFHGISGHAGTVPMAMRADALCGAAELVLAVEKLARESEGRVVATVGELELANAAVNMIPGETRVTVDIRSDDGRQLSAAYEEIQILCREIAAQRNLRVEWELLQSTPPVPCDAGMRSMLQEAILAAGLEPLELVSGAGHDAVPVSAVAPVCMLFVRCYKGISHHPLEDVETKDIVAAIGVADEFLRKLAENYQHEKRPPGRH